MGLIFNSVYNISNLKFWYKIHEYSPSISAVLTVSGLVTSYLFAVYVQEDVTPVIPRISHTGNFPPSSMIFTFTLGMAAILMNLVVFTLHLLSNKFAASVLLEKSITRCGRYKTFYARNILCRIFGFGASVGVLGVGSFQNANSRLMHNLALVTFGAFGFLFFILHSYQSRDYFFKNSSTGKVLFAVRSILIALTALAVIGMAINTGISYSFWEPSVNCSKQERVRWKVFNNCSELHSNYKEDDGGFVFYVAANVFQWAWLAAYLILLGSIQMDLVRINYLMKEKWFTNQRSNDNKIFTTRETFF